MRGIGGLFWSKSSRAGRQVNLINQNSNGMQHIPD